MKLSEIKGDRVLDVIADLIDPICNIAQDEKASEILKRKTLPKGMTAEQFVMKRARAALPALLKGHKADIIKIFATINDVTPEKYAEEMTLTSLVGDLVELLTDEAFLAVFTSAQSGGGGNSSGSVQANTTAEA